MDSSFIMGANSKKKLFDIYTKHYKTILASKGFSQQFIYMCVVHGTSQWIVRLFDERQGCKKIDEKIYNTFTIMEKPYINERIISDGRISIGKMADEMCNQYPKFGELIRSLLLDEEPKDPKVKDFLQKKRYTIPGSLEFLYNQITSGVISTSILTKYLDKLGSTSIIGFNYRLPCWAIHRYIKELSETSVGLDQIGPCQCDKNAYHCLVLSWNCDDSFAQFIPRSFLVRDFRHLPDTYLLYIIRKGYMNVNDIFAKHSICPRCYPVLYENIKKHLNILIQYGLFFDPMLMFAIPEDPAEMQGVFNRWLKSRPQDFMLMISAGLIMRYEFIPIAAKYAPLNISLFNVERIEDAILHHMTFMFNINRIEDYLSVQKVCENGLILAVMHKRNNDFIHVLPMDIVKIIHSYLA